MTEQAISFHTGDPTSEQLASFVRELYPFGAENVTVRPYGAGHNNLIFLCEDGPPGLPDEFILRFPKRRDAADALEADYLGRAKLPEGVPAPRALDFGRLSCCGTPVLLEEKIEGEHKPLRGLSDEGIGALARAIAAIHAHGSDRFSSLSGTPGDTEGTYADYIRARVKESVTDRLQTVDMARYPEARQALAVGQMRLNGMLVTQAEAFSGRRFSLLHGDLNPDNMLWGGAEEVTFIDGNYTDGDPADDLDYLDTNNPTSPGFRQVLWDGYRQATGSTDIFGRVPAYTLKNRLDDLAWAISMLEKCGMEAYQDDYTQRLAALQALLDRPA